MPLTTAGKTSGTKINPVTSGRKGNRQRASA